MLTLDLLRFRTEGDVVTPIYLTITGGRKYLAAADRLIGIYRSCLGKTVGELEQTLEEVFGGAQDYKVYRGLAKVMNNYIVSVPASEANAEGLRMTVFSAAASQRPLVRTADLLFHKTASDAAAEIANRLGMTKEVLLGSLYADLKENHLVKELDLSVTASQLIERYNCALAQAMLYRATRMIIDVHDGYRTLFKHIKLARLMHTITPRDGGYRVEIDGPMSLFSNVERYGISMAKVLPAVLKCSEWRLAAKVNVGGGDKLFRVLPRTGLKSHYRDEPEFHSSPEEAFYNRFRRNSKSKWTIEREGSVLDLKDTVMIPDFKFTHKDGRTAHLEIVGFWTPDYLRRKMDKLSRVAQPNVVVALPESLNCSNEDFAGRVIRYKQRLLVNQVLPAIEEAAIVENC